MVESQWGRYLIKNNSGQSSLFYAVQKRGHDTSNIDLLIKSGTDVLERDHMNKTVLHYAAGSGNENLFWRLFEKFRNQKKD